MLKESEEGFIRTSPRRVYVGVVISPLGILDIGVVAARQIAALLPNPEAYSFLAWKNASLRTTWREGSLRQSKADTRRACENRQRCLMLAPIK